MTTPEPTSAGARKLDCKFCQKGFSKAEHLRRHERSHTGSRPFVCKGCKRPFARQDSLARHEKLHTRRDSAKVVSPQSVQHASPQSTLISRPVTPDSLPSQDVSDANGRVVANSAPQDQTWAEPHSIESASFTDLPLDFELIWPDTEDLFQSIISSDNASQWQMPLGALPFPPTPHPPSNASFGSPSSFDDRISSIGTIPSGGNHRAVHDVTEMVTNSSSSVTAAVEDVSITSVFLDECLHMFFVRFIPTFPVLHRATFVFRECTHPLLLNAIAIGSLYLGPKEAVVKGEALWRLAHTAVATSWQTLITHSGPYDACKGVQLVVTALLSQVYGALSKNRAIRTTSQTFHALGFFWARHCGMFDSAPYPTTALPSLSASQAEKDHQWRTWAAREIQQRALLAHYMLDGLIAQMSGETTSVRHAANKLSLPSSDAAFEASTADEWLLHMRTETPDLTPFRSIFRSFFPSTPTTPLLTGLTPSLTSFTIRILLEGLQSLLSDTSDQETVGVPPKSSVLTALSHTHDLISHCPTLSAAERMEALLRWHAISLDAAAPSSHLCRALCTRYNVQQHVFSGCTTSSAFDLPRWVNSQDARRALLHAVAIQDIVEQLPRGRAHVIHMPSSLFAAATVYAAFVLAGVGTVRCPRGVEWREVLGSDASASASQTGMEGYVGLEGLATGVVGAGEETRRFIGGELGAGMGVGASRNLLYELNSMQKLFRCLGSQWGVAWDMEAVVGCWIGVCH